MKIFISEGDRIFDSSGLPVNEGLISEEDNEINFDF